MLVGSSPHGLSMPSNYFILKSSLQNVDAHSQTGLSSTNWKEKFFWHPIIKGR